MAMRTCKAAGVVMAVLIAGIALLAIPATAGRYGHLLGTASDSGSWVNTISASTNGSARHPRTFTVVVRSRAKPSYFCQDKAECRVVLVAWSVACRKNGRFFLKRDQKRSRSRLIVARARLPVRRPDHCTISAGGTLAYQANGRVSVRVYYRN